MFNADKTFQSSMTEFEGRFLLMDGKDIKAEMMESALQVGDDRL